MPDDALPPCSVLLLAGGRGQRMGGRDKGLLEWRGRPLIAWLHDQVRPETDDLIISCNRNAERYAPYADRLIQDDEPDFPGPMAGIRAGLAAARHPYLLVLPCDAPQVDAYLLQALRERSGPRPAIVRQNGFWQPMFCLLPVTIRDAMEEAWRAGERSPQRVLRAYDPIALDVAEDDPRLANFNTPDLLV
ncbi:molybdenum cofactor guanylyltransferase MobA [Pseudomonas matsuisoli]|uniref:Molybdenum cofactor guanylyltransferase n=1 Tax=Pseudomonas matsuisoli TaxID=1515666 RepID=A0A917PJT1_9PSED|nr:molybdenum cofactor guanylyltransferase MobA [Pseudomonas matsuisoli]GGJ81479.1 molybdenum cofactor guanylyltransferase [Pseudomonas matsuisoli]